MIITDGGYFKQKQVVNIGFAKNLIILLFVIYIIGSHLRVSIYSGGSIVVPMYLMLFSSIFLGLLKFKKLLKKSLLLLIFLLSFVIYQPFLSSGDTIYYRSSLQLFGSTVAALFVLFALKDINRDKLRKVLVYLWFIFIILAFIEVLYLKNLFDIVRDFIYSGSGRFVYAEFERDLAIYGKVRSTVFASEPSFLADTLSALAVMVFMFSVNKNQKTAWLHFSLMLLVSFYISPSFKMVFYLIAVVAWYLWPKNVKEFLFLMLVVLSILSGALIAANLILAFVFDVFGSHLTTGSFFGRIGSAHLVGMSALSIHPLFGYGIGSSDEVYSVIVEVWNRTDAFSSFEFYQDLGSKDLMSNGFWWMWIYLGIVGVFVFSIIMARLLKAVGNQSPWRSLVCASIVWYAGSAFIDPQSWFVVVVFSLGTLGQFNKSSEERS